MKYTFERPFQLVTFDRYPSNGNILFSRRRFEAGHEIACHWHDYTEIEIVAEGSADHFINNEQTVLKAGDGYIMSSCDFHGIKAASELVILNLSLRQGSVDSRLENSLGYGVGKIRCELEGREMDRVNELFDRALTEFSRPADQYTELILKNLAEELIVMLLRKSKTEKLSAVPRLVQRAIAEVNAKFRQQLTLNSLAEDLFVTPNYLGTCFKKSIGISFNKYVALTRLRFACGLLVSQSKTVKEIAFESGFSSVEYFLATFRKYLGVNPTAWKAEHLTKADK